jgi:ribosome-associated protein
MDIRKLQRAIVDGLEDVKAQHISVFNTEHLSSMFERVIVASGTSNRQTKALAASVREAVRSRGMPVLSVEGEENGEWIIVDCGAAVAHIMQPAIRDYYHLEEIWGGKAVRMKVGEAKAGLVKASEPHKPARAEGREKQPSHGTTPARKPVAKKAVPKPVAAKKAANKTAAFKRVAAKTPARKAAPAAKGVARKTAVRKTASKKAAPSR